MASCLHCRPSLRERCASFAERKAIIGHSHVVLKLLLLLLAGLFLAMPLDADAQSNSKRRSSEDLAKLVTPESQKTIDLGLAHLAARQFEDGSFGVEGSYGHNVGVTALGGMAFLSSGSTPGRGKYGKHVERALNFIMNSAQPSGYINIRDSESHGPMYGHGFATLFLAEVYGMSRTRKDVRETLRRAVKLIVSTQNKDGGWRYNPVPRNADVSVTVCQIMALRAARNCGIFVPKEVADKCIDYVKRCQNTDGGFRYRLDSRPESAFPRSAAGVVALYSAGVYEGREIERGLAYLAAHVRNGSVFRYHYGNNYFYGHYYGVQAMWQARGRYWRKWYPLIRDELIRRQNSKGYWQDATICDEYATAMALIILQMPNSYLPIFDR